MRHPLLRSAGLPPPRFLVPQPLASPVCSDGPLCSPFPNTCLLLRTAVTDATLGANAAHMPAINFCPLKTLQSKQCASIKATQAKGCARPQSQATAPEAGTAPALAPAQPLAAAQRRPRAGGAPAAAPARRNAAALRAGRGTAPGRGWAPGPTPRHSAAAGQRQHASHGYGRPASQRPAAWQLPSSCAYQQPAAAASGGLCRP